jgi:hypothetical protein
MFLGYATFPARSRDRGIFESYRHNAGSRVLGAGALNLDLRQPQVPQAVSDQLSTLTEPQHFHGCRHSQLTDIKCDRPIGRSRNCAMYQSPGIGGRGMITK